MDTPSSKLASSSAGLEMDAVGAVFPGGVMPSPPSPFPPQARRIAVVRPASVVADVVRRILISPSLR